MDSHLHNTAVMKRLSLDSSLMEYMDANKCIEELLKQLEEERKNVRKEKLAVACLQREIERSQSEGTMREKLIHQLEEERRLRLDSERRLREVTEESQLGHTQMTSLQQHFSRMEDTVRTLLQTQGVLDSTAVDTVDIMKVYKDKLSKEAEILQRQNESSVDKAGAESSNQSEGAREAEREESKEEAKDEEAGDETHCLLERLKALEEENSALAMENESQREQYERCLDEVANQVVQALLTQKDLREECVKLRTRVFDLEQQNRTLGVLFQQKLRPASDLLLQKLYSRLMDLSGGELLLDPERTKHLLLTRNTDSPPHELTGKGFLLAKCASQLSLTAHPHPHAHGYGRSSRSSSELSLSSACSEFSSGSYTWNDGRSSAKLSSLTWEKRSGLGSSMPGNICSPLEDQFPARPKECHILEGLRRLQRRHRPKDTASCRRRTKSGFKDCMNSNEGIYSLGMKAGASGGGAGGAGGLAASKSGPNASGGSAGAGLSGVTSAALAAAAKKFIYDSDDADDESANVSGVRRHRHSIPSQDSTWLCSKKLSHSLSDSLCSWDGTQESCSVSVGVSVGVGTMQDIPSEPPPPYCSQERPEKLLSFINGYLFGGKRCSAPTPITQMQYELNSGDMMDGLLHLSESDDTECDSLPQVKSLSEKGVLASSSVTTVTTKVSRGTEIPEKDAKRFSRDSDQMHRLRREQVRAQSADSRPRPLSLVKDQKTVQSEESITTIFDAEGKPIKLRESRKPKSAGSGARPNEVPGKMGPPDYAELVAHDRPSQLRGPSGRTYNVLESPEKPGETHIRAHSAGRTSTSREGSAERLQGQPGHQQHKLIKPPYNRASKGQSVPPTVANAASPKAPGGSKIPATRGKASPLKVNLGPCVESGGSQDSSPSSPPVKLSRFLKAPGSGQSPKTAAPTTGSKLPGKGEWGRSASSSPHLNRRHLNHVDCGEQPTRDRHFEKAKSELRSPSPPPPPGRTTSLLIRPNYEVTPQAPKSGGATPPSAPNTARGPPPSYQPPSIPNMQHSCPQKDVDALEVDAGYGTVNPQKLADGGSHHSQKSSSSSSSNQASTKGLQKRVHTKLYLSNSSPGHMPDHQSETASRTPQKSGAVPSSKTPQKAPPPSQQSTIQTKKAPVTQCPVPCLQDCAEPKSAQMTSAEQAAKTRIPMGFKGFMKSPAALKKSSTIPGKQEKDHINTVSKETASSDGLREQSEKAAPPPYHLHLPPVRGTVEPKALPPPPPPAQFPVPVPIQLPLPLPLSPGQRNSVEESTQTSPQGDSLGGMMGEKAADRDSRLFKRSISITSKPHLKPALGMNGAKARSQSFSTNYMEKPTINTSAVNSPDGPGGKIRTQIITNTAEKRNSLTRQSSLGEGTQFKPGTGLPESGSSPAVSRPSQAEGITGSNSHHGLPDKTSKLKGEVVSPSPQKEARSLPLSDRLGLKNSRRPAKVSSHPQFESTSFPTTTTPEGALSPGKSSAFSKQEVKSSGQNQPIGGGQSKPEEESEKPAVVCSIEEKVMMGIEENLQAKIQGLERSNSSEGKQKTGSSLANWFGFRKSKLPAMNGKKTDSPKAAKEDKKSVLGGRQAKTDKKKEKEKKKNDNTPIKDCKEEFVITDNSNKMNAIMDHCNIQMGHITSQLQSSPAYIGKDQFVKEFLGRTVVKGDSHAASVAAISLARRSGEMKGEVEIRSDTTILVTQKLTLHGEREEDHASEPVCQDHMIGSSCQMRTLDSGIGTFPLPQAGRNPAKPDLPADAAVTSENRDRQEEGKEEKKEKEKKEEKKMKEASGLPVATLTLSSTLNSPCPAPSPGPCPGPALVPASAPCSLCCPTVPCPSCPSCPVTTKVPSLLPETPLPRQQLHQQHQHQQQGPRVVVTNPGDAARETRSLLRPPSSSEIIVNPKRFSQSEFPTRRTEIPVSSNKPTEKKRRNAKDQSLPQDRVLQVCAYSGSSDSECEVPLECARGAINLRSPQSTQLNKTHSGGQVGRVDELKRRSFGGLRSTPIDFAHHPHQLQHQPQHQHQRQHGRSGSVGGIGGLGGTSGIPGWSGGGPRAEGGHAPRPRSQYLPRTTEYSLDAALTASTRDNHCKGKLDERMPPPSTGIPQQATTRIPLDPLGCRAASSGGGGGGVPTTSSGAGGLSSGGAATAGGGVPRLQRPVCTGVGGSSGIGGGGGNRNSTGGGVAGSGVAGPGR